MARPHFASPALRTALAAAAADFSLSATSSTPAACTMIKPSVGFQLAAWQTSPAGRPLIQQSRATLCDCSAGAANNAVQSSCRHASHCAASRCQQTAMRGWPTLVASSLWPLHTSFSATLAPSHSLPTGSSLSSTPWSICLLHCTLPGPSSWRLGDWCQQTVQVPEGMAPCACSHKCRAGTAGLSKLCLALPTSDT